MQKSIPSTQFSLVKNVYFWAALVTFVALGIGLYQLIAHRERDIKKDADTNAKLSRKWVALPGSNVGESGRTFECVQMDETPTTEQKIAASGLGAHDTKGQCEMVGCNAKDARCCATGWKWVPVYEDAAGFDHGKIVDGACVQLDPSTHLPGKESDLNLNSCGPTMHLNTGGTAKHRACANYGLIRDPNFVKIGNWPLGFTRPYNHEKFGGWTDIDRPSLNDRWVHLSCEYPGRPPWAQNDLDSNQWRPLEYFSQKPTVVRAYKKDGVGYNDQLSNIHSWDDKAVAHSSFVVIGWDRYNGAGHIPEHCKLAPGDRLLHSEFKKILDFPKAP